LEVCEELDYHPSIHAARLFSKRAKVVAFLVALPELIDDDNLSRSLFGVYRALERKGYRTLPLTLTKDFLEAKEHLNIFKRQEADGLIVWGARDEHTFLDEVAGDGHPLMLLMNPVKGIPACRPTRRKP
jgi:DNA-binding LacI/PurR family transcriptional regulator